MSASRRTRFAVAVTVLLVSLGVLAVVATAAVRSFLPDDPPVAELRNRLGIVAEDRVLRSAAPGAVLVHEESVLCADSLSPYHLRRYRYGGPFESVMAFYDDSLRKDGWRRSETALNGAVGFDRRFDGWTADGLVTATGDGYRLLVVVDDGYESGCDR